LPKERIDGCDTGVGGSGPLSDIVDVDYSEYGDDEAEAEGEDDGHFDLGGHLEGCDEDD
jgi:hypothetical protein